MKNCLNCRWEPEWSKWTGGEYSRCGGRCQIKIDIPALPRTWHIQKDYIERYEDNSGIPSGCKTWEPKEN